MGASLSCCHRRQPTGYVGETENGFRHGEGSLRLKIGAVYSGQWAFGAMSGHGKWMYPNSSGSYVGQWKNNRMHGQGILKLPNNVKYEGQWQEGRFHDHGELDFSDGSRYEGTFRNGLEHGSGKLQLADGKTYEGSWHKGTVNGRGTLSYPEGRGGKCFMGQFRDSKPHGVGKMTYSDGVQYVGQWQYGAPAGRGVWKDAEGKILLGSAAEPYSVTPVSSVRPSPRARDGLPFGFTAGSSGPPSSFGDGEFSDIELQGFMDEGFANSLRCIEEVDGAEPMSSTAEACTSADSAADDDSGAVGGSSSAGAEVYDKFGALDAKLREESLADVKAGQDDCLSSRLPPKTAIGLPYNERVLERLAVQSAESTGQAHETKQLLSQV
eukprot:TRINITY_DN67865_c0_g1_i1.p1 TRINITY_DN67865_c0_g1~~TRINITY_DN67865_c0_g1_i1.p1  ORF type:complete len:381 (-),score=70.15 TRINITY_DN67865_c0_g1_i1:324-1466(-)